MGGGLMQLVAYGAQDVYLTGNPQITFFKVVYRRHTNFSMEAIEQTWNGTSVSSGRCTATISRNGDLVSRLYIEIGGTTGNNTNGDNVGSSFINYVELEIGGQRIDKHSGKWMETWAELTEPNPSGTVAAINASTASGDGTLFQNMSGMGGVMGENNVLVKCFVPLQFWFCRNPGLALPLIALQYHEVKVILDQFVDTTFPNGNITNKLWADYIYLDTDERRRFAQVSHEYLIEQVQEQALSNSSGDHELHFNHPVKELIWSAASTAPGTVTATSLVQVCGTVGGGDDFLGTFKLKLNGHDRFAERNYKYFSRNQVWQHHSGHGGLNSGAVGDSGGSNDSICVYSFALKPEEHQPSGTCNFSRIDTAQLNTSEAFVANTHIFAVNYNVLRIMSGMGGLAYSN
jgi:hypothetical protein